MSNIADLGKFIDNAITPYHCIEQTKNILLDNGYIQLFENKDWQLQPGSNYFVIRADSSCCMFNLPTTSIIENGSRIVGAHSDSPCLKLKPNPHIATAGVKQLALDVYGGVLLHTWFDRNLAIAGKVNYEIDGRLQSTLIDSEQPLGYLPNLAIHLNRSVNAKHSIDKHEHLKLVVTSNDFNLNDYLTSLIETKINSKISKIYSYDLSCYDTDKFQCIGADKSFFTASRIDNLVSCYAAIKSMLLCDNSLFNVAVFFDHEEVGSESYLGAAGNFLTQVLTRIISDKVEYSKTIANSLLVSADGAHALHPNYLEKYDANNSPIINKGVVIKTNYNQNYATNSSNSALIKQIASKLKLPLQDFVIHGNLSCGSTIGPISATRLGIDTIDIGVAQWAMHSIKEIAGCLDIEQFIAILTEFYNTAQLLEIKN